jgi:hypothetical protein
MGKCVYVDGGRPCEEDTIGMAQYCEVHLLQGKSESVITQLPTRKRGWATFDHEPRPKGHPVADDEGD